MENLKCLTYSHNLGDIQKIDIVKNEIQSAIDENNIENYVKLQTCNRIEVYYFSERSKTFEDYKFSVYEDEKCLKHLLRVVSGIDSLVVGEDEILHQVREAYNNSKEKNNSNNRIRRIFDLALRFGKKIRRETEINSGKTSVVSIGMDKASEMINSMEETEAVVIGAGRIGEKTVQYLDDLGVNSIMVANRNYDKASEIVNEIGGKNYRLSELQDLIREAKLVICATGAPHYILTEEKIPTLKNEKVLIDFSVPSNVEPEVRNKENIKYISYEDLTGKARENLIDRKEEVKNIENRIEELIENYPKKEGIEGLANQFEKIREKQLEKAKKIVNEENYEDVLEKFSESLTNKMISTVKKNED